MRLLVANLGDQILVLVLWTTGTSALAFVIVGGVVVRPAQELRKRGDQIQQRHVAAAVGRCRASPVCENWLDR